MEAENGRQREYKPMFRITEEDLFIKKEDFKFKDNTKPKKQEKINRNYEILFSEEKSYRIDELIRKYYSQRATIKSMATWLRLRFIEKVKKLYSLEKCLWETINLLTSNVNDKGHESVLEGFSMNPLVKKIEENNGITTLETTLAKIQVSEIATIFPNLDVHDAARDIRERLTNSKENKSGDCHYLGIQYSKRLKNLGIENNVITANRKIISDKSTYMHSWVEFQMNGREYVLDATQNMVMNKEGYYALGHIDKIISRINCVDIEKDEKIYSQLNSRNYYMDFKTYLTCRDEMMRDLQKNINIFNEER